MGGMPHTSYDFPDPEIPSIDADGLMIPPWLKYPGLPIGSIGWRMGDGEGYLDDFREWWKVQSEVIRANVRAKYPAIQGWERFYDEWT
jgi:hypothetical protein